jgi:putative methylase
MKQKELEIALERLKKSDSPEPSLEQYQTTAVIAAEILYNALGNGDIDGKSVIDLGCGNGIFSIGASLLGARLVTAVDMDRKAIELARTNAETAGCNIEFICEDVEKMQGKFDTCIQNPPFGSQARHADMPFLKKAIGLGEVVYTIHNSKTDDFVEKEIGRLGGKIDLRKQYDFEIRHTFDFHTKERAYFKVTLFRVLNKKE